MTRKEITALALKFFSLFILIELLNLFVFHGIGSIFMVYSWYFSPGSLPSLDASQVVVVLLIALMAITLPLVMAFFLWQLANGLVEDAKVREVSNTRSEPGSLPHKDLIEIMLVGLGLWVAVTALPDLASSATRIATEYHYTPAGLEGNVSADTVVWFASSVVKLAVGITFIFGRHGWAAVLCKLRRGRV